jgi:hypothetical protein
VLKNWFKKTKTLCPVKKEQLFPTYLFSRAKNEMAVFSHLENKCVKKSFTSFLKNK